MPVTRHPSHRSQHALLTHWAPALGSGVKAVQRLRMKNTNRRKEALQQNFKSLPWHAVALTSSPKRSQPVPLYTLEEIIQTWPIAGHRIISSGIYSHISALQVIFCTKKQEKSSAENVLIRALICGPIVPSWVAGIVPALVLSVFTFRCKEMNHCTLPKYKVLRPLPVLQILD